MPSPVYITSERPSEVIMRRPYAISIPGTGETVCASSSAITAAPPVASAVVQRNGRNRGTSISKPLAASTAINTAWLCPVPIHGIRIMLADSAPKIAPPVLAA